MTKQEIINQKPLPLPPEIIAQLTARIDPAATKEVGTKGGFTSIKAYYIIERLNNVFGVHGWTHTCEVVYSNDKDLAVKGKLILWDYGIVIEEMGGSNDRDVADRFKGAKTSSFSKATSILGVGREIYAQGYSGKQPPPPPQQTQPPKPKKPTFNVGSKKNLDKAIEKVMKDNGEIKWYGRNKNVLYCNQYQYHLSPEMIKLAKATL